MITKVPRYCDLELVVLVEGIEKDSNEVRSRQDLAPRKDGEDTSL
jgi:hypothetical protein